MTQFQRSSWVLLTGSTGVLGSHVLSELLTRGHRVLCLVRADTPSGARTRLASSARLAYGDLEPHFETGQLAAVRGDLHQPQLGLAPPVVKRLRGGVSTIVHAAGSTVFETRPDGEPARTNLEGTRNIFALARDLDCRKWHLVSTAYVCGLRRRAAESHYDSPPDFRNAYEHSKWLAECESLEAAERAGAELSVHRPGVIVGHSQTGATIRYNGIYYLFRALSLIARSADQQGFDRTRIPLRIRANASDRPNLSFVDDVARDLVDIVEQEAPAGGVYHLTHPKPPTNRMIKRALEQYYGVGGGRFVGSQEKSDPGEQSDYECMFAAGLGSLSAYLLDAPDFDRTRTNRCARTQPAPWTMARLLKLLDFAERCGWRAERCPSTDESAAMDYADYFERFLPARLAESKFAWLSGLDLDVRYCIEDAADGDWLCRFRGGRLQRVQRAREQSAEVVYRLDATSFWRTISGTLAASDLFLSGGARIEGDIERALKFAAIVQDFVREYPYDRQHATQAAR